MRTLLSQAASATSLTETPFNPAITVATRSTVRLSLRPLSICPETNLPCFRDAGSGRALSRYIVIASDITISYYGASVSNCSRFKGIWRIISNCSSVRKHTPFTLIPSPRSTSCNISFLEPAKECTRTPHGNLSKYGLIISMKSEQKLRTCRNRGNCTCRARSS